MADVLLTVRDTSRSAGVNVTDLDTAVTSADAFFAPNNGNVRLIVVNAAGANNVTVTTPNTVDGLAVADLVISLTASKTYVLGPFPPAIYNNSAGQVRFTVSANADVTVVRG